MAPIPGMPPSKKGARRTRTRRAARQACQPTSLPCVSQNANETPEDEGMRPGCRPCLRVRFNFEAMRVYEVTPYSEIYGEHPRDFVFGREAEMLPAVFGGFVGRDSWGIGDEDEDEDEELGVDASSKCRADAEDSLCDRLAVHSDTEEHAYNVLQTLIAPDVCRDDHEDDWTWSEFDGAREHHMFTHRS